MAKSLFKRVLSSNAPKPVKYIAYWYILKPSISLLLLLLSLLFAVVLPLSVVSPTYVDVWSVLLLGFAVSTFPSIILSIFDYILGYNLLKGKNWARLLIIIISLNGLLRVIYTLFTIKSFDFTMIGILIDVPIAYYLLFDKKTERYFEK